MTASSDRPGRGRAQRSRRDLRIGFIAALAFVCSFSFAATVSANQLLVETRSLQMNDLLTITVMLDGPFATADSVNIPLQNLVLVGEPSVSSEFQWINGEVSRQKVFRYRARAVQPGRAQVGPVVVTGDEGQRDTLQAVAIQVMPDLASGSNDAQTVLRELIASNREPLFVIAEADKKSVYVGEPVTVTWWLYNAAAVQEWQVVSIPKLAEFWTEERPHEEQPERVYVGDTMLQRLAIRKATLFPLRSGNLRIAGISVEASVMRRTRGGPFAIFEGELVDTTFTSATVDLDVKPIPPGPPVDAVGDLILTCDSPMQRNSGPVVVRAVLAGAGNVRAAAPPRFEAAVDGQVQIEGGDVTVSRDDPGFSASRQWRYLIFPAKAGPLEIPTLSMRVFVPSTGQRMSLRCEQRLIDAVIAPPPVAAAPSRPEESETRPSMRPWIFALLLVVAGVILLVPRMRRVLAIRRESRAIVDGATPAEIRERVSQRVKLDLHDMTERGDAWRALNSLLDAAERDRDIAVNGEAEIRRRVRDVLELRN